VAGLVWVTCQPLGREREIEGRTTSLTALTGSYDKKSEENYTTVTYRRKQNYLSASKTGVHMQVLSCGPSHVIISCFFLLHNPEILSITPNAISKPFRPLFLFEFLILLYLIIL
jgi:hypothetical protein